MLCQLLCLDRRYQRMNCFNVRELQSLLKSRFFTELTSTDEQHEFFEQTAIGVRFKNFGMNVINPNIFLLYKSLISADTRGRFQLYDNILSGPSFHATQFSSTSPVGRLLQSIEAAAHQDFLNLLH
jgi:hypothetical protein